MRVGVVLEQALAPIPGGSGRFSIELAAGLARRAGPGDAVTSWVARHADVSPARVVGVVGPRRLALPAPLLIRSWERGGPPRLSGVDVIQAPTLLIPPSPKPVVVSIHDAVPWTHPETLSARGVRWHRKMAERAVRQAAAITVLTRTVAAELIRFLPGLDSDRVVVLGAGVSSALLAEPDPETTRKVLERLALPERYLLSLATVEPRKGLDVLIAALGRLIPNCALGDGPQLVIVGQPGWGEVDLESLMSAQGVPPDRVRVLGKLTDSDLAVVLRRATALVMPSRAEGFGLPVAEALAVGTPVICSDAPALVEVAADAAIVVPRGDESALAEAIEAVWTDDQLRVRLRTFGLQVGQRYTWDAVADRAWQLYRRLS
ncbi:glycosyltransferase family 4 protein [Jatrophihabitans sp. DSM 45814]